MGSYSQYIEDYIELERKVLSELDVEAIDGALTLLVDGWERGSTVYVFGNGGSSATASHFQNDFNKGLSELLEKKFHFVCLNDNVPTIFRYQLRGRAKAGDIVIAISGSGNSPNVINAVEYAKEQGCSVIGLTGYTGGKLKAMSDISLHAPVMSMQVAEDIHMIFDHLMMSVLYKTMCGIDHLKG